MEEQLTAIKLRIPDGSSKEWICSTVDRLCDTGFNTLIPETFYHGYTIYPSNTARRSGFPAQRATFFGWDPLAVMLAKARRRGMRVFTWVETFYVGNDLIEGQGLILSLKPEWQIRRADGSTRPGGVESGHHFICPANTEAREYLSDLYSELAKTYEPDGVFIDYLRYPLGSLLDNPFCYCDNCRVRLKQEKGFNIDSIPLDVQNAEFKQWTKWREQQTQEAMELFYHCIKQASVGTAVIANVYGGFSPDILKRDTLRNWIDWCNVGIVDILSTQNYAADNEAIAQIAADLARIPPEIPFLPAIDVEDIANGGKQTEFIGSTRALGVAYFVLSKMQGFFDTSHKL